MNLTKKSEGEGENGFDTKGSSRKKGGVGERPKDPKRPRKGGRSIGMQILESGGA